MIPTSMFYSNFRAWHMDSADFEQFSACIVLFRNVPRDCPCRMKLVHVVICFYNKFYGVIRNAIFILFYMKICNSENWKFEHVSSLFCYRIFFSRFLRVLYSRVISTFVAISQENWLVRKIFNFNVLMLTENYTAVSFSKLTKLAASSLKFSIFLGFSWVMFC